MVEPNKRKVAFREEALNLLGNLNRDPEYEDVRTAYKLDCFECTLHDESLSHPKAQNCRDNPYCINRLGLEKFSALLKKVQQKADKVEKKNARRSVHGIPCGLQNSGNFCYVNSFLQVFFNDPKFRQVVYKWRPSPDFVRPTPPKMDVQAVMSSMQKVFYYLEYSPFEDSKTHDFTDLLRLGNMQQDAQEFTLMFLAALERYLPTHPNGKPVLDFLKQRFFGKISNRTWCECGGRDSKEVQPFMSLQLPIDGHNTLPKAISHHFDVERLHECKCNACGRHDKVCRKAEIIELPDVLIIQLNRYINDVVKMCQRKLRSPLAYPRVLRAKFLQPSLSDDQDHDYELFAVMIHEGDNTHCGHYYDLVKHPFNDQWYKYNDEVVEALPKPPGYDKMARFNAAKASNDMKTCYGLLYRRKEAIYTCEPPDPEICLPWREEFESNFSNMAGKEIKKSSNCVREVKARFTELNNVFASLKAHTDRYKNEKNLAFIPLDLLTDVVDKEREYAQKQLDEIEEDSETEPTTKATKLSNGISSPSKRKEKSGKVSREEIAVMLKTTSMKLCPHGLVHIDSVLFGDVKIVSRTSVENLLSRYNFAVKRISDSTEENASLLTGADLCIDCARLMQQESVFKRRLEATTKQIAKILREKHRDSMHKKEKDPTHYYVSKKALINFRKLAEQQFRFEHWLDDDKHLMFLPAAKQNPTSAPPTIIVDSRANRARKRRLPSVDPDGSEAVNGKDRSQSRDNSEVKTVLDDMLSEVCSSTTYLDTNGKSDDDVNKGDIINGDSEASQSRPSTPPNVKPEQVVFNSNLSCEHRKINIPEFRYAVSPEEWEELTSYFSSSYVVKCSDPVCENCLKNEADRMTEAEEHKQQKKEMKQHFGDIIRVLEKRLPDPNNDVGSKYMFGICSTFVNNMKAAFKRTTDNFELPRLCQDCVICELHNRPFRPFISTLPIQTREIVPITDKEWNALSSLWPKERIEEVVPIHLVKGGDVLNFCVECFDENMQAERLSRMVFEDKYVYVRVEVAESNGDCKDEVIPEKRGSRRANQKNVHKFKMSHNDTVKDLKVKLYEKTHQTPMDQILYNGSMLLENEQTLFEARIEPDNIDKPLRLIVQTVQPSPTKFIDEDREPEMGFTGTALTY